MIAAALGAGLLVRADLRGNGTLIGCRESLDTGGDVSFRRLAGDGAFVGDGVGRLLAAAWEAEIAPVEVAGALIALPLALAAALFDRL